MVTGRKGKDIMRTTRAGWAEVDITPPLGLPMGGRGPRFTPGASVLDPLTAEALVLEDKEGRRTLWISMDLIGLSYGIGSILRYNLAAITGIPPEAVILNSAHVHSGPMTSFDSYATDKPKPKELQTYERERDGKIIRMAHEAVDNLKPVTINLHTGTSDFGINRRNVNGSGVMGMRPNPDGVYNPDLWVLDIATSSGNDRCVLFCYGCHPVIVYGFAWDGISADYPGSVRRGLREELGGAVHCQFIQGLAGNVRPRILSDLDAVKFRKSTPADLDMAGTQLTRDVIKALDDEGETLKLSIAAATGSFQAERDRERIPPAEHWQSLARDKDELRRNLGRYWAKRLRSGLPPVRAVPWDVGLLRLTRKHLIAWLAGEPVAEWLGHLRSWLGNDRLIAWGYCQHVTDYLPTDELIPEGGYEVIDSNQYGKTGPGPFSEGLNEAARQAFLSLARWVEFHS